MAHVTLSSSTAPPTMRTPTGMNDLPDEILDDIALFAEEKDHPNLALVEQRWYEPARRQNSFYSTGFASLMGFAEVLLQRPGLSHLVRTAQLQGTPACGTPLLARAMEVVLQEYKQVRVLEIDEVVQPRVCEDLAAVGRLMSTVGALRHLEWLALHVRIPITLLALAVPAMSSLEFVQASLDLPSPSPPLPPLPPCSIFEVKLDANIDSSPTVLLPVLNMLVQGDTQIIDIRVRLLEWRAFLPTSAELNTFLPPFIAKVRDFYIDVTGYDPRRPDWQHIEVPPEVGWIHCHMEHRNLGGEMDEFGTTMFSTGSWMHCKGRMIAIIKKMVPRFKVMPVVWARRGRDWSDADVEDLEDVASYGRQEVQWQ